MFDAKWFIAYRLVQSGYFFFSNLNVLLQFGLGRTPFDLPCALVDPKTSSPQAFPIVLTNNFQV